MTEEPELRSLTARLPIGERRFLAEFANALSALTHPCVLILDDFQELRAPRRAASSSIRCCATPQRSFVW